MSGRFMALSTLRPGFTRLLNSIGNKNNSFRDSSCLKCKLNSASVILSFPVTVAAARCVKLKETSKCQ